MYKKFLLPFFIVAFISLVSFRILVGKNSYITVGVVDDYPPFSYASGNYNDLSGLDIDLINAIGKEINKEIKFKVAKVSDLIEMLKKKEVDIVMSGLPVKFLNSSRFKKVISYIPYEALIVNEKDCIVYPSDVPERESFSRVGAQDGTIEEYRSIQNKALFSPKGYNVRILKGLSSSHLISSLNKGEIDGIYMLNVKFAYLNSIHNNKFKCYPINSVNSVNKLSDNSVFHAGIAILKNRKPLHRVVEAGLKELKENGEYDAVRMSWVTGYNDSINM